MYLAEAQTLPRHISWIPSGVGTGIHPHHIRSPPLCHNVKNGRIPTRISTIPGPGETRSFWQTMIEPGFRPHVNPGFGFVFFLPH